MKITTTQYANSLYEATAGKSQQEIGVVVADFIKLLQKSRKIKLTEKIIAKFSEIYNQKNGIVEAEVITKCDMGHATMDRVKSFIKEKYQAKEVVIKNIIDENIKGGIVIKVGDEVLDGSVARQLKNLNNALGQ